MIYIGLFLNLVMIVATMLVVREVEQSDTLKFWIGAVLVAEFLLISLIWDVLILIGFSVAFVGRENNIYDSKNEDEAKSCGYKFFCSGLIGDAGVRQMRYKVGRVIM